LDPQYLPPPPPPAQSASSQAVTALVLGILGIVCCALMGPVAWYLGNQETQAIREGRSPVAGVGFAKAGTILGIVASVLFCLQILWVLFFGGMAFLSALAGHH
jgi:hypothetical protein